MLKKIVKIIPVLFSLVLLVSFSAFAEKTEKRKIVIGYSNSLHESIWRERMIKDSIEVFDFYRARGMVDDIIVQHSGMDVRTQTKQIRSMIIQGVDCILINPGSVSALSDSIKEAEEAGIPVIVFDRELPDELKTVALNVVIDRVEEGYKSSKWIAEKLGGRGSVVLMFGFEGVAITEKKREGVSRGFGEYPGIEILETVYGQWNPGVAESVMKDVISDYTEIDAVWAENSMSIGALSAFEGTGRPLPVCTGDPTKEFLLYAKARIDEGMDLKFFCYPNPPGIGATALAIAIYIANGHTLKRPLPMNTYYYPVKSFVTHENIEKYLEIMNEEPETAWISEYASDYEIRGMFK